MFFAQAIACLEESGVAYCVVGGLAVSLHGIPRTTYDLDVVVVPDADSLAKTDRALRAIGLEPRLPVSLVEFADADTRRRALDERSLRAVTFADPGDPLREVDVLISPPIDPVALVARARRVAIGTLTAKVVDLADLVAMKRAAGRPQDLADVVHLERLLAGRR